MAACASEPRSWHARSCSQAAAGGRKRADHRRCYVRQPVKLHEYQAKQILARAGIPIPDGLLATSPQEAEGAAKTFAAPVAVKAQVHVGGRGKAGGIKVAKSPAEAKAAAGAIR